MKIHVNDMVQIIAGKDKGKQGSVKRILQKTGRVVVEGVNMVTKHLKKNQGQGGQKVQVEASIDISNVQVVCPKTKKPTRIGYTTAKSGEKVRVAKVSGEVLSTKWSKK